MVSKHYEFRRKSHGHFICENCKSIIDFNLEAQEIPSDLEEYDVNTVEILYRGLCPDCKNKDL